MLDKYRAVQFPNGNILLNQQDSSSALIIPAQSAAAHNICHIAGPSEWALVAVHNETEEQKDATVNFVMNFVMNFVITSQESLAEYLQALSYKEA